MGKQRWNGNGYVGGDPALWANLFEISNRQDLSLAYRLVDIAGLPAGQHYDKNLNQLVKAVAYDLRQPVALVRQGDAHQLAIPASSRLPQGEVALTPHVARLTPRDEEHSLDLSRLDGATTPIASRFLEYSLRTPLMQDQGLWSIWQTYYHKDALNAGEQSAVDLYPGFSWGVIADDDGRLFLRVDVTTKYVERQWLASRPGGDAGRYGGKHVLYHFGHQWYTVQLAGPTGNSIVRQRFQPGNDTAITDVYSYTQQRWASDPPPWVRDLDPESAAIIYRYPGKGQERYGALALCKLTLNTADAEASGLHRRAILEPVKRLERIVQTVEQRFQRAKLGGVPIKIAPRPLELRRRIFPVPAQHFGQDRLLAVGRTGDSNLPQGATDIVPLDKLGQRRQQLLLDPQAGPLDKTPFAPQFILLPQSSPRSVNDDFAERFERAMCQVSGQPAYRLRRILYDDRGATSLHRQVQAIERALISNGIGHGYALLVLPERAHPDLHNYVKRTRWPALQFQCAMARKIHAHYRSIGAGGSLAVAPEQESRLTSYVRNCALAMMVVNRKWGWSLAEPLHHDVHIGVDVLNGVAGFTFVYDRGRHIFFRDCQSKQREKLTAAQMRDTLTRHLREDLESLGLRPRSIVVHRDGRTFASEIKGLHLAVRDLQMAGVLPVDVTIGIVDLRKTSADQLRLFDGQYLETVRNPPIGSWLAMGARRGIVCTTGWPFRFPGTALPLTAVIVEGQLNIADVLADLFALSQLIFTAPDKCARLPVLIKLADDCLAPIAGAADDDAALYDDGEELDEMEGSGEDGVSVAADD